MSNSSIRYQVSDMHNRKIAIVHDWLYGGGAERVVLELHRMFPDAPIYTSYSSDEWRERLDGKVITGYLQHPPFRQLRKFLPLLRQWWFRSLDLSDYDLVISSSGNGEAKFIRVKKPAVHVCYCHTPTHFYWRHYDEYVQNPSFKPKWLARLGLKILVKPLRRRDYQAAQAVNTYIANSSHIHSDIKQFYKKDAVVITPPVDVERFRKAKQPAKRHGFVTMGRQVPLKKTDMLIEACNRLKLPLTVIGRGPEHDRLVALAGPTITFKTDVTDEQMPGELAKAEAFLFGSFEDFGVAPVEAMAAGTPVIAYKAGGALDYVVPGVSGQFFNDQTVGSLVEALQRFEAATYKPSVIQNHAEQFDAKHFQQKVSDLLQSL